MTRKFGVKIAPTVDPPEQYGAALVHILSELGEVELSWADYQPHPEFDTRAIEIALPNGKVFAIRIV